MSGQKRCLDDQDPDYPDVSSGDSKRQRLAIEQARTNSCEKIRRIIRNQFGMELRQREEQIVECQDRLHQARQALQLLRYLAVTSYYQSSQTSQEQTRLHPAVKKLVGTQRNLEQVLNLDIPSTSRIHPVIASTSSVAGTSKDTTHSRSEGEHQQAITKQPRYIPPKEKEANVIISPPRAANLKVKTRLVVGNVSKWIHEDIREDSATHKWMLYVRGTPEAPNVSHLVERVRFFLHASYQPHDVIEVCNSPFHLSRRGWGEFPVRVQIHFHHPQNRPLDVIHQLRLDHTYTGLQTLGAETVVDVWLFEEHHKPESIKTTTPSILSTIKQEPSNEQDVSQLQMDNTFPKVPASRSLLKSMNTTESKKQDSLLNKPAGISTESENITFVHATDAITSRPSSNQNKLVHNFAEQIRATQNNASCSKINVDEQQTKISPSVPSASQSKPIYMSTVKKTLTFSTPKLKIKQEPHETSSQLTKNVDGTLRLQHHDNAKPVVIKIEESGSNMKTNKCITVPVKQSQHVIKLNTIRPTIVDALQQEPNKVASKQIIHLKSFAMSSNTSNKNPLQVFRTSILKSTNVNNPGLQNGIKSTTVMNGSNLTFKNPSDATKRIICLSVDKNGVFQQIPSILPQSVPPLVMISKYKHTPGCSKNAPDIKPKLADLEITLTEAEKINQLTLQYEQQFRELEVRRTDDEEVATLYLLRGLPLIKRADEIYQQLHPYVAPSSKVFLSWPLGKRKASEAMRAREVSKLLVAQGFPARKIWTIGKLASRYGFTPFATNAKIKQESQEATSKGVSASLCTYAEPNETLAWLETTTEKREEEENTVIDIETLDANAPSVKTEVKPVPKLSSKGPIEESASCVGVKTIAAQIGISLLPEDIGKDAMICASQIIILEASKHLVEDLVRRSFAASRSKNKGSIDIEVADVQSALQSRPEFDLFTNQGLGVELENVFR